MYQETCYFLDLGNKKLNYADPQTVIYSLTETQMFTSLLTRTETKTEISSKTETKVCTLK